MKLSVGGEPCYFSTRGHNACEASASLLSMCSVPYSGTAITTPWGCKSRPIHSGQLVASGRVIAWLSVSGPMNLYVCLWGAEWVVRATGAEIICGADGTRSLWCIPEDADQVPILSGRPWSVPQTLLFGRCQNLVSIRPASHVHTVDNLLRELFFSKGVKNRASCEL